MHVRIASPKPVNSPSFIPTNNLQPPPNLLQKPPQDLRSGSLNKMDPLKLLPRETLKVDSASIDPTPPSLPLTPRSSNTSNVPPLQPRQAKLAHSLVSVAKPKAPEVAVKKEAPVDDILFRCPMDP